jgi:hypothetical protein
MFLKRGHCHILNASAGKAKSAQMVRGPKHVSRRTALAALAVASGFAMAGPIADSATAGDDPGPVFSPTAPDAELYGAAKGFPIANPALRYPPGNPLTPNYRVGAFSHHDKIFPTRQIGRAATPWIFKRSQADITYQYKGNRSSIANICPAIPSPVS